MIKKIEKLFTQKNYTKCLKLIQKELKIKKNSPNLWSYLFSCYKSLNNKTKYQKALENALENRIIDVFIFNELASLYLEQKQYKKALICCKASLKLNPNQKIIKYKQNLAEKLLNIPEKFPKFLFLRIKSKDISREKNIFDLPVLPIGINILFSELEKNKNFYHIQNYTKKTAFPDINPNIIALSLVEETIEETIKVINKLKKQDVFIILGGPFTTIAPEISLELFSDNNIIVLRGEAENRLSKIIKLLDKKPSKFKLSKNKKNILNSIKGLYFKFNNQEISKHYYKTVYLPAESLEKEKINYQILLAYSGLSNVLTLSSSRGCPNQCYFCCQPEGKKYRAVSGQKIVSDIENYYKLIGSTYYQKFIVSFVDNDFLINKKRVVEFINIFNTKPYKDKFKFIFQTSINSLKHNKELIPLLKKINIFYIDIGTDSFEDNDLKRLGKAGTLKDIEFVTDLLEKHQIPNEQNTILSNINTNFSEFKTHIKNIIKLHKKYKYFKIGSINKFLIPNINTKTYAQIINHNLLKYTESKKIIPNYLKIEKEYPKDTKLKNFLKKYEIDINYNNSKEENLELFKKIIKKL